MKRPPAGRRAFEALGRRHEAIGLPYLTFRSCTLSWPMWARRAYCSGRLNQHTNLAKDRT